MRILFQPEIEYDPVKNQLNMLKHGLSFEMVKTIDWSQVLILEDRRNDYQERRYLAFALLLNRLFTLVFTLRNGKIRVISLRKSNDREMLKYERER